MELAELRQIADTERTDQQRLVRIRCCTAAGCLSSGSGAVRDALSKSVDAAQLASKVHVAPVGCMRLCCEGPLVQIDPGAALFETVKPDDAAAIVDWATHESKGETGLRIGDPLSLFFTKQMPIVLE